jgi:hypothetical protein
MVWHGEFGPEGTTLNGQCGVPRFKDRGGKVSRV